MVATLLLLVALFPLVLYQADPAVVDLRIENLKIVNQYSGGYQIKGIVQNKGVTEFKFSGDAVLYRDSQILTKVSFGTLTAKQSFEVIYDMPNGESCDSPYSALVSYSLKIEYPTINAPPTDVDSNFGNNMMELKVSTICATIYTTFLNNYRTGLLNLINQYRQSNGLSPLTMDPCLNNVAQGHAEWMKATNTFSHTGKGNSSPSQRCVGCPSCTNTENIFEGWDITGQDCFNQWKSSPGHNANMLSAATKIGIGCAQGMVVADFA
jgi:uncharacterized protein YkwD